MAYKTFKVMLLPNNWQETRLLQCADAARFAYNWALEKEMESLKNGKGLISDADLRKEFTQLKKQPEYAWLNNVLAEATKQAIKDLVSAYICYFAKKEIQGYRPYSKKQLERAKAAGKTLTEYEKNGHPRFKKKKDKTSYAFYQGPDKLIVKDRTVRITSLQKHGNLKRKAIKSSIKLAEKGRIPSDAKYNNSRITYDGLHWWLSVSIETEITNLKDTQKTDGIGIDVGIENLLIIDDGTKVPNINKTMTIKKLEKKKKRLCRKISRMHSVNNTKEDSHNVEKAKQTLLKVEDRLYNVRHDHRQKAVNALIKRNPRYICIEDLNIKGMLRNKHLAKMIQDQGLYELRRLIEYKAQENDIPLILVDRWYPSSKTCNCCGKINRNLKLSDRMFRCDCGYVEDRDVNAAKNLKNYGLNKN